MSTIVRFLDNELAVNLLNQGGVLVPELVSHDLKAVAVPERLDGVGIPPSVELGPREIQDLACGPMDAEGGILPDAGEQRGIFGEALGIIREDPPRPEVGPSDDSIPPSILPATGVDRPLLDVNISACDPLYNLPLHARGGHESLDSAVRHGESTDQSLGLYAVQPAGVNLVGGSPLDITYDIGRDDVRTTEPLPESGQGGVVSVLRGARALKPIQKGSDPGLREVTSGKQCSPGDQAPDLGLVLGGLCGPRFDERREIGTSEGGKKTVQLASLGVVVDESQLRSLFDDCTEGSPFAFVVEILDESLYIVRHFTVRSAASEKPRPAIIERNPSLPPLGALRSVRHGQENGIAATQSATSTGEVR